MWLTNEFLDHDLFSTLDGHGKYTPKGASARHATIDINKVFFLHV